MQNVSAVDIEDLLLESTYNLGEGELCLLNVDYITEYPSMHEEEYILSMIEKNKNFDEVHQAFGYINQKKEYMLVAAILKQKDVDKYYLAGTTGTNYGNTNEL